MKTLTNKLKHSMHAHATLRFHGKRIEIGVRIPPEMVQHIVDFADKKKKNAKKR